MDSSVEDNVCVRSFLPTTDLLPPWNGARGEGRQRCEGECTACRPHVCVYVILSPPDPKRVSTVDDSQALYMHTALRLSWTKYVFLCVLQVS